MEDDARLRRIAELYESRYGSDWHFDVWDGAFEHPGGRAMVYEVSAETAFGFRKDQYSQTRWRLGRELGPGRAQPRSGRPLPILREAPER